MEKIFIKIDKAELDYITLSRNSSVLIYLVQTKLTQDLFKNACEGVP